MSMGTLSSPGVRRPHYSTAGMASIKEADNLINHFVIVGDMSPSMHPHSRTFVKAFDSLVQTLASRSKELDQETRVTVYLFSSTSVCAFYDMDVLRLPSIAKLYDPSKGYRTAILDATVRALDDLKATPQKYGQHAFVLYTLTDGAENDSHLVNRPEFRRRVDYLPDNWTVAALVPDMEGVRQAQSLGFPAGNIDKWDTTSALGSAEAMTAVTRSIDNFMTARQTAQQSGKTFTRSTNLFSMDSSTLNQPNLFKAGITPVDPAKYSIFTVPLPANGAEIKPFVRDHVGTYRLGMAFYQLVKREEVQPQKQIAIVSKKDGKVYTGEHARELLGLPGNSVKISPGYNPEFDVYIQSTSVNRKLRGNQKILVML